MEKPQKYESRPYYDLICVLNYVDKKVKRFKDKMWDKLCNLGYINNDTTTSIWFEGFYSDVEDEDIIEGLEYMFEEFPDIKNNEVDFWISW